MTGKASKWESSRIGGKIKSHGAAGSGDWERRGVAGDLHPVLLLAHQPQGGDTEREERKYGWERGEGRGVVKMGVW